MSIRNRSSNLLLLFGCLVMRTVGRNIDVIKNVHRAGALALLRERALIQPV